MGMKKRNARGSNGFQKGNKLWMGEKEMMKEDLTGPHSINQSLPNEAKFDKRTQIIFEPSILMSPSVTRHVLCK